LGEENLRIGEPDTGMRNQRRDNTGTWCEKKRDTVPRQKHARGKKRGGG